MSKYGYDFITLDKPEAQAFIRDLVDLCNRHRMRLSGDACYPLVIERLPDGVSITGIDTEGTAFFNGDPPYNFDLKVEP